MKQSHDPQETFPRDQSDVDLKAELTGRLSMIAAYSYISTEIVASDSGSNDGNALPQTPRHLGALWVNYRVPGQGALGDVDLGLGARYTGDYYTAADNAFEIEDAVIVDAAVGYALTDATEMRLNVSNLLDEQHVAQTGFTANYYNPGREVALTLRHRW